MRNFRRQSAFTMTELIVAFAIAAILVAVAIPSYIDLVERKRLKLVAETVIADFNFFRQEGLKRRVADFSFNVIAGDNWCYGIEVGACSCATAGEDDSCSVRQVVKSDFVGVDSISSSASKYTYNWVRGVVTAGNISLVTAGGFDLRVVITPLGRTSICSPSDNVPGYSAC